MKVGTLVRIISEILPILERDGIIDANDDFHAPSPTQWAALAIEIEQVVKKHGVTVQDEVDRIVNGLPLILALVGVK